MDFATLKAFKPSEYEGAADGYRAMDNSAERAKDAVDNRISAGIQNQVEGATARAALGQLQQLAQNLHYLQTECGLASAALYGFAFDIEAAKRKLKAAIEDAHAANCTVTSDGSVSYPAGGDKVDGKVPEGGKVEGSPGPWDPSSAAVRRQAINIHPNPNYGKAVGFADRIADALQEATEADAKWAPKLQALKADDDLVVSNKDWADTQKDMKGVRDAGESYLNSLPQPPKDGSPKDNAAWWKGLTLEEQEAWVSLRPNTTGGLDGLPSSVRDEANRTVFAEKRAHVLMELNGIPKPPDNEWTWIKSGGYPSKVHTDEWTEWHRQYGHRYEQLTKARDGMNSIQNRFDATGKESLPEAYLLGFSADGNGRAIIANGNPDTADHQAVYTPGTTANLGAIRGDIDRMTELWRQTNAAAPDASVSTITWLGYDAPQDIVKDAPFEHYAYDGAPAYRQFMDGLDASYSGSGDPHRTAIGHSYGTTLIGAAAQTGDLNADDVIFAGSPGVKVGSADEMDVPKGHVWNEEADGDPVPDIGRWGHGGSQWKYGGGTGIIPSDDLFGANQMNTHPEGSGPGTTKGAEGHSEYWNRGTTALKNQAWVVVGKHGYVTAPE
ncbi:alpha/beta hydrolase [Streptomyces sp. NPDC048638]|uniref:alpha/beta hydrolase n=1 Tax=Streptomyces sp. NPDC048638 TaxID=3365580 RepID=UPI003715040E